MIHLPATHPPAVIVHGRADAAAALAPGRAVTLLSAPGAALFAGAGWWRALVEQALEDRAEASRSVPVHDILDCADDASQALAALRLGQRWLVLQPDAPGFAAAAAIATARGGGVLAAAPPALDLAQPSARERLDGWLAGAARDAGRGGPG